MTTQPIQALSQNEALCLDHFADLGTAMNAAILAIAENSLEALEDSLWKQQVLCVALQHSVHTLRRNGIDPAAARRLQGAAAALQILSGTYTDLIGQASSSAEILYKLCLSYKQTDKPSRLPRPASSCSFEA